MNTAVARVLERDEQDILALSKQIKIKLPKEATKAAIVMRYCSIQAYHMILDTVTKHGEYVGSDGKGSTSKGGFVIQINKKIKAVFGKPVEQIANEIDLLTLRIIREAVARTIQKGEALELPRPEIKKQVYDVIEKQYETFN